MGSERSGRTGDARRDRDADEDAELMLAAASGDEDAFAKLVRRYQGRVVSLAYRYLGSAADAEDLAQEVFLRIHRARESYQPTARFSTWIYRVTVNASLNYLRGRKVRKAVSGEMPAAGGPGGETGAEGADYADRVPDAAAPSPPDELEKSELYALLRETIEGLPDRQRAAILLNKYEGLSYEETAAAMEMSLPAVKSLLTRARVNLKERLEPYMRIGAAPESGQPGPTGEDESGSNP